MEILNYTPNTINIYSGAELDPKTKKWKGGHLINTFPSVGILNARMEEITEYIREDGIIFKRTRTIEYSCDELPVFPEGTNTYFIVTRAYLTVAKLKGWDVSHLLTAGGIVVDDAGNVIGTAFLNMN